MTSIFSNPVHEVITQAGADAKADEKWFAFVTRDIGALAGCENVVELHDNLSKTRRRRRRHGELGYISIEYTGSMCGGVTVNTSNRHVWRVTSREIQILNPYIIYCWSETSIGRILQAVRTNPTRSLAGPLMFRFQDLIHNSHQNLKGWKMS